MFRKKVFSVFIVLTIILTFGLSGCTNTKTTTTDNSKQASNVEEITFVNWASAEESSRPYVNQAIVDFEKQNPNIKVKSVPVAISDIANQLTIMMMGGNAPDIAQINVNEGVTLASMGGILETDNLVPQDLASDTYYKKSWDLGMYNGKHFGMPWVAQPQGFYYNKTLMKQAGLDPNKPPKTIEEFNSDLEQARKNLPAEVLMIGLDTTIRTIGLDQEWPLMRSFGALPVNDKKVAANSQQMNDYATWLRKMVKGGYTLPGKKFGEFRPIAAQNHLLFMIDEPQFKGIVQSLDKTLTDEKFYQNWGITTVPAGADGKSYSAPDDHHLVLFKASKHQAAALKFAEYLANNEAAFKDYNAKIGVLPATESGFKKYQDLFGDQVRKTFLSDVLPNVVPLPVGPNLAKVSTVIMAGMQEVISTDKPIPGILNGVQTKLEGIINGQ